MLILENSIRKIMHFVFKYRYILLICISILILIPYIYASLFIHPFADDLIFSESIVESGRWGYVSEYFRNWTGRYTVLLIYSIPALNPLDSLEGYFIISLSIMLFFIFSVYFLISEFLKGIHTKFECFAISLAIIAHYVAFMPEIFSAFYWNCASYYMVILSLYLLFLRFIYTIYIKSNRKIRWYHLISLFTFVLLVNGLHELIIIYNILLFGTIILYRYFLNSKRVFDVLTFSLLIFSILIFIIVMKFSGNSIRTDTNKESVGILSVILKSGYELFLLNFARLWSSPVGMILLFVALLLVKNEGIRQNSLVRVHPLIILGFGSCLIFIAHSLSLYGAGYTLQGRVLNVNLFLFYIFIFLFILSFLSKINYSLDEKLRVSVVFTLVFMVSLGSLSKNTTTVLSESTYILPQFDKELKSRYDIILNAKEKKYISVIIPPIRTNPRLITLGEYNKNINFYNSNKWLKQASNFFNIDIKMSIKPDVYDFN